jgi:hypothetical protein
MKTEEKSGDELRLIGQQLSSVLTAVDYITLKFVKYPLSSTGAFADGALVDIEEGFEIAENGETRIVRKSDGLGVFQKGSVNFINLIGRVIVNARSGSDGGLVLQFDNHAIARLFINEQGFDSFSLTFKT